jgi:hypothetical protein
MPVVGYMADHLLNEQEVTVKERKAWVAASYAGPPDLILETVDEAARGSGPAAGWRDWLHRWTVWSCDQRRRPPRGSFELALQMPPVGPADDQWFAWLAWRDTDNHEYRNQLALIAWLVRAD